MRDWTGRTGAEGLRQWPVLASLVGRIEDRSDVYDGAILLGSLVLGRGDALSDVDLVAVVREGRFSEAWDRRAELSDGELYAWDHVEGDREVKAHKWLTRDLVKVECLIATPSSGMRLAEPIAVLAGDPSLPGRFTRREAISRADVDAYAQELRDAGLVHEAEAAYSDLKSTLRRLLR